MEPDTQVIQEEAATPQVPVKYYFYHAEVSARWGEDGNEDSYYDNVSGMVAIEADKNPIQVYDIIFNLNKKNFVEYLDLVNKVSAKFQLTMTKIQKISW